MESKKIDKISVMVEIDGQVCSVILDETTKRILPDVLSSLSPDGILKVAKLSSDYKFETLEDSDISAT